MTALSDDHVGTDPDEGSLGRYAPWLVPVIVVVAAWLIKRYAGKVYLQLEAFIFWSYTLLSVSDVSILEHYCVPLLIAPISLYSPLFICVFWLVGWLVGLCTLQLQSVLDIHICDLRLSIILPFSRQKQLTD